MSAESPALEEPQGSSPAASSNPARTLPGPPAHAPSDGAVPPPTSWTVARAAGVSQSTVSRALRGDPRVREDTRRRVDAAARKLGYVPNSLAAGLVSRSTRTVAVIVSDLGNPFFPALLTPIYDELQLMGYRVVLFTERTDIPTGQETLRRLLDRSIDGVLVTTATLDSRFAGELQHRGLPMVLLNRYIDGMDVDRVVSDNRGGAVIGGRHLIDLGHRRIAAIRGPSNTSTSRDRLEGLQEALAEGGAPLDPALVREGTYSHQSGYQHARELLRLPDPPTAIVCGNDVLAFGALLEAQRLGIEVPKSLSIVGFDDLELANQLAPPLTTVQVPTESMWRLAADRLMAALRGDAAPERTVLDVQLVVRGSTGPPPRR